MKDQTLSRRNFIQQTRNGMLVATAFSMVPARAFGANDRLRIGIIGCGSRAYSSLIPEILQFAGEENVVIRAVCDVWRQHREEAAAKVEAHFNTAPQAYVDYEELLAQPDLDAVVIATPEHQHTTMLEKAIQAGKDVYCEKPLAMNMAELNQAVDAVKASDRVVQMGTQLRSWPSFTGCRQVVREGQLGQVVKVMQVRNTYRPYWHDYIRPIKEEDTDWKRFLFNKEDRPFDADQHSTWYGYRDFTIGPIASMMAHFVDLIHYITGVGFPESAVCLANTYAWKDARTVPDSMHALLDYKQFMVSFCVAYGNGGGNSMRFFGTKGMLDATNWREPILSGEGSQDPDRVKEAHQVPDAEATPHMQNWLQCLRTRKKPHADIDAGYQHAVACILANEALLHKRQMVYHHETRSIQPA